MTTPTEAMGGQDWKDIQHLKAKAEVMERLLFAHDETIRHLSNAVLDLGKANATLRKRLTETETRQWKGACRA